MPLMIHGLCRHELIALAQARLASGAGRASEIHRQLFHTGRYAPDEHGLSAASVAAWRQHFAGDLPRVVEVVEEPGPGPGPNTAKAVLAGLDGARFECVRIPMGRGRCSLCVSCQVGCRMGCRFCQTAAMGWRRDLTAEEIVGQVLVARHGLGWAVRNVVFMGMGEPLDNWLALRQALAVLADRPGLSFTQERLNICTVGHVEGIARLAEAGYRRINLSFSLNAGDDALRATLMPSARRWPLAAIQQALLAFRSRTNQLLIINYCLLPGINDRLADLDGIADFCRPLGRQVVNLIPYNPGLQALAPAPTDQQIETFIDALRARGLPVRRRMTKGRSVMAACGQLGGPVAEDA